MAGKTIPTTNKTKKRLIFAFAMICVVCVLLCFAVGWRQVVRAEEYSKIALEQQTRDIPIPAKRGAILDRNGKELAVSAETFSVWAVPAQVRGSKGEAEEKAAKVNETATLLSEVLQMPFEEVHQLISKEQSRVKVAKYQERATVEKIRELRRDGKLTGIEIGEDVKRYYPMGPFAAHLLGSVTDENVGLAGIETQYNQFLSGVSGRWIKNSDASGNSLAYGVEKYYQAEDGLNLTLTIDEVIQHYVEKTLENTQVSTKADRVMCLMMDPKTGDILAMAITPDFDPNNPRVPLASDAALYVESLNNEEKAEYWNKKMWRNPIVSDVYEPGSTSKLLTTAIALEEGLTNFNEPFYCTGSVKVATETLKCWSYRKPHGAENLVQAVGNSCNPVFVELGRRINKDRFLSYMELFGLTEKTGIDYPGEAGPLIQKYDNIRAVELATMSYGQGIAVTMLQQLTAICSLGNEGKLMQPRLVKSLKDSDGNVVKEFEPKVVRQVISEKTAEEMCLIMEYVVSEGGGKTAKIPGYRVGGKTGTANKPSDTGAYSEQTYSSFVGMAPMDDPQVAILLVVDNPKDQKFGSLVAAPGAKQILEETLRYMNIKPSYTQEEETALQNSMVAVPEVTGKNCFGEAVGILQASGLNYTISPAPAENSPDFVIVDQFPKAGEKIKAGGTVFLYRE